MTKDVRSRTGISQRRVSVATIVTDLAKKIFGKLDRARVALVGAGNMAELTLKALVAEKALVTVIANRSPAAAEELASCYGGKATGLDALDSEALAADVVVASAASPEPIISAESVGNAARARRGRPMLMVDLGVPRNIEPEASDVADVILYDMDDLKNVVAENVAYRLEQADQARALISEEVMKFASLLRADSASTAIAKLSETFRRVGEDECSRALGRLGELSDEQRHELAHMAQRIVGKMLHPPITALKDEARQGNGKETEEMIRRIFGL